VNQATAPLRPIRESSAASLAGLVPAQALYNAVCADPSAPLTVAVVGPGGCGKSALLAALHQAYLAAGVSVVGTGAAAAGLTPSLDVAVLVDDAHQLAGPDLDRLRRLALTGDVRLVVAYRPWPRKPELTEFEDALGGHQPPVLLDRLDRRGIQIRCAALLGGALPAAVVDLLCEQTGGVPMLIDRVVDSLRTGDRLDGDLPELPPEVLDRVRHDLDRLAPQLRALLLAVGLGAGPDPDILAQVLALDLAVVTDLLSRAHSSGLLLGGGLDEGARVIPLVRRALVAGAAPGTRRVVQRLVLAAHLERGRPVLDLAHQLVEAGARGSDLAGVFEAAADAALSELEVARARTDSDLDHLVRVNVKGKLLFYTDTGEELTYSLKQSHRFTRPGCLRCPDFAAEHADISFGGLGQEGGWTLSIVRTDLGQEIWDRAIAEGVIEVTRAMDEDPKAVELMFRLAQRSRERWPSPEELATAGSTPGLVPAQPDTD